MKRLFPFLLSLLFLTLIFSSCAKKSFSTSLTCEELATSLKKEISVPEGEFKEYDGDELNFLFSSPELYSDICVIYSADSTDVCELGIIHASSEENAQRLYEEAKRYIKSIQEEKSEFLRNYSPEELPKLNSAEARCYGEYIVFSVAEQNDKNEVFKKIKTLLEK